MSDRCSDGRPTTKAELDKVVFCWLDWGRFLKLVMRPDRRSLAVTLSPFIDPLKNLIMQQHLLSPALPSSPIDILPAPSPQAVTPSAYSDSAMTATMTTTAVKRKRTDIPDTVTKPVVKKKKANRACIHCQKAHLTCDDCSYFASTRCASFFRVCSQHDWFFVPQQDHVSGVSSVVCQTTASRVTERRLNISSTTWNSVNIRFSHISRTGDLILVPTPHRGPPARKGCQARKGRKQRP